MRTPAPLPLVAFLVLAFSSTHLHPHAQQTYPSQFLTEDCKVRHPENAGYVCNSSSAESNCDTALYFRVQAGNYMSLSSIAQNLFSTNSSAIAAASGLSSPNVSLAVGQGLFVPVPCTCYGNHSSYNITYVIVAGDTFFKLANTTYEGLTTCQAIQDENPSAVVTNLQIGQVVEFPLRCACPSPAQRLLGVRWLYTYPVKDGDSISSIISMFNLTEGLFLDANSLPNNTSPLFPATTVLLPFVNKPSVPPNGTATPSSPSATSTGPSQASSGSSKTGIYVGIGVGIPALLLIIAAAFFLRRIKRKKTPKKTLISEKPLSPTSIPLPKNQKQQSELFESMSKLTGSDKLTTFTLDELKLATDNFNPSTHIRGSVYRGVIKGRVVAIKNMTRNVSKELQILQKVHHSSLVTLLGVCIASAEQSYLVYEYAENGSLSDWLHDNDSSMGYGRSFSTLTWNNRLQVALDIATAMEYIHEHTSPSFVHKGIKSSNILLDAKFRGRLANFGLAKPMEDVQQKQETQGTRHIEGTQGYLAPEYLSFGRVSPKMDVFAFGVVLLEILSGEEAKANGGFLYKAIGPLLSGSDAKQKLKEWMDPRLQNAFPLDCAFSVAVLAKSCVAEDPAARPSSRDVSYTLAKVLEISLEWEPSDMNDENYTENPLEAR